MTPSTAPIVQTERLVLRAFAPSDEEPLLQLWNEPEVRRFLWDDQRVIERLGMTDEHERTVGPHHVLTRYRRLRRRDFRAGPERFTVLPLTCGNAKAPSR